MRFNITTLLLIFGQLIMVQIYKSEHIPFIYFFKPHTIFHRKLKTDCIELITEEDSPRFTLTMDYIQMSHTHHRLPSPKLGFHPSNLGFHQEQA